MRVPGIAGGGVAENHAALSIKFTAFRPARRGNPAKQLIDKVNF
jgi:hypothetical protein